MRFGWTKQNKFTVLELDLSRGITASEPSNPLEALRQLNAASMRSIRIGLRKAVTDHRVKGLIIHIGTAPFSATEGDEIAHLIREFAAKKPAIAYTESFGEFGVALQAYKVAAAANQIWLQESGRVTIGGMHLDITLLKGMLAKIGVEPQFGQRKGYKTAADRFAADEVTPANREMTTRLGQSLVEEAVASIAQDRSLSVEQVWEAVNLGQLTPEQATAAGLIDRVGYRDQVYAEALSEWGASVEDLIFVHRYAEAERLAARLPRPGKDSVAVVSVRGQIVVGRGQMSPLSGPSAGSDTVCEHIRSAERDDSVQALLLQVDSPGGSYVASDTIHRAVLQFRESGRPVVAVMGGVAASGGYFVSMPATEIVAAPSTLTGSIGVLAGKMVTAGLYERLGLVREGVNIGARAGFLDPGQPFTEDDWRQLDEALDLIYADFTSKAAKDRGMSLQELEPLAHGRVWTGADAHQRGLVDRLGGMDIGIDRVCALAGLNREGIKFKPVGALGLLERFRPARNSEALTAVSVALPRSADELVTQLGASLGITVPGVLSLPMQLQVS